MKRLTRLNYCFFILFIIVQICFCIFLANKKNLVFGDEVYSYGLANSENYSFLDYKPFHEYAGDTWVNKDYYYNYVSVDKGADLSFKAPYINQENDNHPPLYYCLLHLVCYLFAGSFTKWTGIGLNLFILVFLDLVFFYIAMYLYRGDYIKSIFTIGMWSFSAAGISNILYIRMYLLLTFFILVYVAIHVGIAKDKKLSLVSYLELFLCVVFGGLTHYYFYPYVFFFSLFICIYLLCSKKFKQLFLYSLDLCSAFILNLVIFPATITHIFSGYRGTEVRSNLRSENRDFCFNLYGEWIDKSFFAGTIKALIIIGAGIFLCKIFLDIIGVWSGKSLYKKLDNYLIDDLYRIGIGLVSVISALGFAYVAIIGSELNSNRYIYPLYPFLAIIVVSFCYWILSLFLSKKSSFVFGTAFIILFLCFGSVKSYHLDFFYPEYPEFIVKANSVKGYDCLQYFGEGWVNLYGAIDLKFKYDESYFFNDDDIKNLQEILDKRKTKDNLVVSFSDTCPSEVIDRVMHKVMDITGNDEYQVVYDFKYNMQVYELK